MKKFLLVLSLVSFGFSSLQAMRSLLLLDKKSSVNEMRSIISIL